jgi:hypothetical protein
VTKSAVSGDVLIEALVSDIGDVQVVLRPELPFTPESFRIDRSQGSLSLRGEGVKIDFEDISEDVLSAAEEAEQILVLEFPKTGGETLRETDLLLLP